MFDFSSGSFWQTELGGEVKKFAQDIEFKKLGQPISASDIAQKLRLRQGRSSAYLVSNLAKSGILAEVEADEESGRFSFKPAQAIVAGLAFLHLERGYDFEELPELLEQLLMGTEFSRFVGEIDAVHRAPGGKTVFFANDSRWRQFPLNPVEDFDDEEGSAGNGNDISLLSGTLPRVELDKIQEVKGYTRERLSELGMVIPNDSESFGRDDRGVKISDEVLGILMWVRAFHLGELRNFRRGEVPRNGQVREAINLCLVDMQFMDEDPCHLIHVLLANERRFWQEISDKREEQ